MNEKKLALLQEEIVSVPEVLDYTYFNALYLMKSLKSSPSNLKKFRYASTFESVLWQNQFQDMADDKKLFFYALLDEMKSLLKWYGNNYPKQRVNGANNLEVFSFSLRLSIAGYLGVKILKKSFFDSLADLMGPVGDAFRSLIYISNDNAEKGFADFFWNDQASYIGIEGDVSVFSDNEDMGTFLHGIVRIFENSELIDGYASFAKEASSFFEFIEQDDFFDNFFSMKEAIHLSVVAQIAEEESPTTNVLFVKRFPLWVSIDGDNTFFPFIFADLISVKSQELILLLLYIRLYLSAPADKKEIIKEHSFKYVVSLLMDKNVSSLSSFTENAKKLSTILLSSGTIEEQRSFFALAHNKKTIQLSTPDIETIVKEESQDITLQFKALADAGKLTEEKGKDLIKLFFINIYEKLDKFLSQRGSIIYADFSKDEIDEITKMISNIVNSTIPTIIKRGGTVGE